MLQPLEPVRPSTADRRAEHSAREAVFAVWVAVSLLSLVLGTALAKYGQAWAGDAWHPSAVWGACVVVGSVLLALVAAGRYARVRPPLLLTPSERLLLSLATSVVVALGWAALAVIIFAGPDLPLRRPGP